MREDMKGIERFVIWAIAASALLSIGGLVAVVWVVVKVLQHFGIV